MSNGALEVVKQTVTYTAGEALLDRSFVKIDSNGEMVQAVDGDQIAGATRNSTAAQGDQVSVALMDAGNIVQVQSGAAVTLGAKVASDANGRCIDAATGDHQVGTADEGSAALGEFAIVRLSSGIIEPA